ncbi:MAG: HAD family hydrolase [Chloroflexota bacterium]
MTGRTRGWTGPRPRLLASDIDGTLIDWGAMPSPRVRRALGLVRESGVHVVLATGRSPWNGLDDIAGAVGLVGPQITLQGALVADPFAGTVVRARELADALVAEALDVALTLGLPASVATTEGYRTPSGRVTDPAAWLEGATPVRIFIATDPSAHAQAAAEAQRLLADRASITWGDPSGFDVLSPGTDKGEALGWLAASLGIPMTEVAAVGDAANDRGMLAAAGASVAMAAAGPEIRAVARHVARGPEDDGLVDALAWLFPDLAGRLPD